MRSHLTDDELALYDSDQPDKRNLVQWSAPSVVAYLIENWVIPAVLTGMFLVGSIALFFFGGNDFIRAGVGLVMIILGVMLWVLLIRLWFRTYTRYVITPDRIMQMSGIYERAQSSIQWVSITDLSDNASFVAQFFGFGDISVETANEASKFKELTEVPRAKDFLALMNDARSLKTAPPKPKATPINEAALKALVSLEKMFSEGGLVVEPASSGRGWKLRKDTDPPPDEDGFAD